MNWALIYFLKFLKVKFSLKKVKTKVKHIDRYIYLKLILSSKMSKRWFYLFCGSKTLISNVILYVKKLSWILNTPVDFKTVAKNIKNGKKINWVFETNFHNFDQCYKYLINLKNLPFRLKETVFAEFSSNWKPCF